MSTRTKIFLALLLTAMLIAVASTAAYYLKGSSSVAAIDECQDEHLPSIGGVNGVEIRLTRVTCGIEAPYFEISAPSEKVSEEAAVEHAFTFSEDPDCEFFHKTLYTSGDLVIGCCPMPIAPAGAGGGARELVKVVKVNVADGTFSHQDFQEFIINSGDWDEKSDKFIENDSCSNKKIAIDFDRVSTL